MADLLPNGLPAERTRSIPGHATALVGRRFVLEQLARSVEHDFATVLWGPPGVGKSRLAHAMAERWFDGHADGDVWVVDLADITDEATALALISAALTDGAPPPDPSAHIQRMLARPRAILLVLDHCEQLAGSLQRWIEQWASDGAGRLLATSRVAVTDVSFAVPALGEDEALRLIEQGAQRVRNSFRLDASTREDVRQLIRSVDALPGAIELLAPRLMLLSANDLAKRLDGGPGALHHAIERSWQLLDDRQQSVLRQLAVTRQGFDVELAEKIVRCDGDVLDVLESLTRHAWLHTVELDGVRLQLLHEPHRFLRELGVDGEARERHVAAMIELGERWDLGIETADEFDSTRNLTTNLPNLWAAWAHASGTDRVRLALVLHLALQRGGAQERQEELTDEAVRLAEAADDAPLLARALLARARVLRWYGRVDESILHLERSLPIGDAATRCGALRNLAAAAYAADDLEGARRWADGALRAAEDEGTTLDEINARNGLGFLLSTTGQLAEAEEQLQRALELASRPEQPDGLYALVSSSLANLAASAGRWLDAEAHSSQALAIYERAGYQRQLPLELLYRAEARLASGRAEAAERDIDKAASIARRWAYDSLSLRALYLRGVCAIARADVAAAMTALGAASARLRMREDTRLATEVRFATAVARLLADDTDGALAELEGLEHPDATWLANFASGRASGSWVAAGPLRQVCVDALASQGATLTVDADGRGFCWSGGEPVDLTRRRALRGILDALAARHRAAPLTLEEIMEAGWPGEVMTVDSGNRRVYVTIKRLRDLGLGEALLTVGDGYMLDPDVPVLRG